jgi:magnesium-transporting ATPase (P-type)
VAAPSGLTAAEVLASRAEHGTNVLPEPRRPSAARRFAGQLLHFFALMLWVAAGLAFAAGMPQLGIAIIAVVVLNAVFAFVQEGRADRAAERLRSLLPTRVTVVRDGRQVDVDASAIVVGDCVRLEPGDRVPADARLLRATALRMDTSMLTGESEPTASRAGEEVLAGTFVVEGDGTALVESVGAATRLADISRLTSLTPKPETPLSKELRRVVRTIAGIALGVGSLFFVLTLLLGNPASDGFIFAVGVTVALVPEALLPTVTLTLAWGAERMARRNVLVRGLEAVPNPRLDDLHLHGQDGDLDAQRDDGGGGVDAGWRRHGQDSGVRTGGRHRGEPGRGASRHPPAVRNRVGLLGRLRRGGQRCVACAWRSHGGRP